MQNQSMLYGIIGLLGGVIITWAIATTAVNTRNTGMMGMMGMHNQGSSMMNMDNDHMGSSHMGMSMDDMANSLKSKTGDDFDKAFLSEMIDHHQGAIDMATQAKQNAKHNELKQLANNITSAQTSEINQMKTWQKEWGY